MSDAERLAHLEARVEALSATLKTVLTTLVLRGVLTKPAVDAIVREAEAMVESDKDAVDEVESVRKLLAQADQALYQAKKQNEKRWKMFVGIR